MDALLSENQTRMVLVDMHAEATSEKLAMGWFLDGRVSAVWGTHTHVQTSDACVLPRGTGYISDLGMTGPSDSVLGIAPEQSIRKFLGDPPRRDEQAKGPGELAGARVTGDTSSVHPGGSAVACRRSVCASGARDIRRPRARAFCAAFMRRRRAA